MVAVARHDRPHDLSNDSTADVFGCTVAVWLETQQKLSAGSNNAALDDMTNTLRESSEDAMAGDGVRTSQSMSKQWVRLRQQQAEARKIILAKENIISSLQSQLQRQQEQTGAFVEWRITYAWFIVSL